MNVPHTSIRHCARGGFLALVATLASACGGDYPQSTVAPTTEFADVSQSLYITVFIWTMIILVVVWAALAVVIVRFREKPGQPLPKQVRGDLGAEMAWTIGPAIIVVAIAIPTIQGVFATQRPARGDPMVVEVVGHRYWWEFRY
ncbi:MAG: cytochrome c oxidase subunit II transmembrane domain-containing protein, partial [Acidimicrobiia bacterium]|nr:cytochrome c oxidase subunit II transmembrane domain-containing protein [Acidimicrobiia bacterium]